MRIIQGKSVSKNSEWEWVRIFRWDEIRTSEWEFMGENDWEYLGETKSGKVRMIPGNCMCAMDRGERDWLREFK